MTLLLVTLIVLISILFYFSNLGPKLHPVMNPLSGEREGVWVEHRHARVYLSFMDARGLLCSLRPAKDGEIYRLGSNTKGFSPTGLYFEYEKRGRKLTLLHNHMDLDSVVLRGERRLVRFLEGLESLFPKVERSEASV